MGRAPRADGYSAGDVMPARIGSKYLVMSTEGLFLDTVSCSRLREFLLGKTKPTPPTPVEPATLTPEAVSKADAINAQRRADYDQFRHIELVEATSASKFIGRSRRIYARVNLHGREMHADIVTGMLFDGERCLSSTAVRLDGPFTEVTHKKARAYLNAKKQLSGEVAE